MNADRRKALASQVRPARKERRWTQDQLAEKAGVSLGVVSAIERGTAVPQAATLAAVCRALGIPVDDAGAPVARCEECAAWPPDVKVAIDVLGMYLESFEGDERDQKIRSLTLQVVNRTL